MFTRHPARSPRMLVGNGREAPCACRAAVPGRKAESSLFAALGSPNPTQNPALHLIPVPTSSASVLGRKPRRRQRSLPGGWSSQSLFVKAGGGWDQQDSAHPQPVVGQKLSAGLSQALRILSFAFGHGLKPLAKPRQCRWIAALPGAVRVHLKPNQLLHGPGMGINRYQMVEQVNLTF